MIGTEIPNATVVFSVDVDWAPGWMIAELADEIARNDLATTWFATKGLNTLRELPQTQQSEVAIHPDTKIHDENIIRADFETLMEAYPDCVGYRSHSLHTSSRISAVAVSLGLRYDSNLLIESTDRPTPFFDCRGLLRFTHHYSDAARLLSHPHSSLQDFDLQQGKLNIFDFHPVHLWLGASQPNVYSRLKTHLASQKILLENATVADLTPFRVRSGWPLLRAFLNATANMEFRTLRQVADTHLSNSEIS